MLLRIYGGMDIYVHVDGVDRHMLLCLCLLQAGQTQIIADTEVIWCCAGSISAGLIGSG